MRKNSKFLIFLLSLSFIACLYNDCKKEEIVIVYSKIQTVGTSNTSSTASDVEGLIEELTETTHAEFGVCWDTLKDPTVYKQKQVVSGAAKTGSFKVNLTGLKPAKTYHTRAFVLDNKKYVYGLNLSFTTSAANLPIVTTTSVSGITSVYALSGGNVTGEGDKPVLSKGVCYDTIAQPTILKTKTIDGWSTGTFTSTLTQLIPSKTYYVRAYAISEFGISYGSQVTFATTAKLFSLHEDYTDNKNSWYTGSDTYGTISLTGGEYVFGYHNTGYLRRTYISIPAFLTMANSKDFEINLRIKNATYDASAANPDMIAGFIWDNASANFKYFGIKKSVPSGTTTASYYCTAGSYSGSYTTWLSYTSFTGTDYNKLTIKKGGGNYYFYVNDIKVLKQAYSNITYDALGFYAQDAIISIDYLYIDQKTDKKTAGYDLIQWITEGGGIHDLIKINDSN